MRGYNQAIQVGTVGKCEEKGATKSGSASCRLSLANDMYEGGETKTQWHTIMAFGQLAEFCLKQNLVGATICAAGPIIYREYEGKIYTSIIANTLNIIKWPNKKDSNITQENIKESEAGDDEVPF